MARPRREPRAWERQLGESAKAFHAFAAYRDLGPVRTHVKAREKTGTNAGSRATWERWATSWSWTERCRAYDADLDRARLLRRKVAAIKEEEDEEAALQVAFGKSLLSVSDMQALDMKGRDAVVALLEVIRLRRLRRGQATEVVQDLPPLQEQEETEDERARVRAALANDPELLQRLEDAALGPMAQPPGPARPDGQPGTVEGLPLPAPGGAAPDAAPPPG